MLIPYACAWILDYEKKRRRDKGIEKWRLRGQAVEENGCGRDWLVW